MTWEGGQAWHASAAYRRELPTQLGRVGEWAVVRGRVEVEEGARLPVPVASEQGGPEAEATSDTGALALPQSVEPGGEGSALVQWA